MIRYIVLVLFILIACEDVNRDWDNPYDPRAVIVLFGRLTALMHKIFL